MRALSPAYPPESDSGIASQPSGVGVHRSGVSDRSEGVCPAPPDGCPLLRPDPGLPSPGLVEFVEEPAWTLVPGNVVDSDAHRLFDQIARPSGPELTVVGLLQ